MDGDTYFWNFGDGTTSYDKNPQHTYYLPNTYSISHTVTDMLTSKDSTISKTDNVIGTSYDTITPIVCDNFISPSGKIYSVSGIYTDTILNHSGCDSVITLNLTIYPIPDNSVTQSGMVLTANQTGATYKWLDCNNGYSVIANEIGQSFTSTQN